MQNFKNNTRYIKNWQGPHNLDILSLFFGTLLGDSHAELRSEKSVRFSLQQENSNCEYLFWFHKYLAERGYCSIKKPKLYKRIGTKGKIRFFYRINSYSYPNLIWFYNAFYKSIDESKNKIKIKHIPSNKYLNTFLTPLSLAVWIMDDGGKCSAGLKIATNSFTYNDLKRIIKFLYVKYKLECSIIKTGHDNQFNIYFLKKTMPKLSKLIKPYIVPSMYYKLNNY